MFSKILRSWAARRHDCQYSPVQLKRLAFESLESRRMLTIDVSGPINVDTTWDQLEGYRIVGDVTIAAGVTLTVSPGVQVETSSSAYDITVNGTLDASNASFTGPTEMNVNSSGELNLVNGTAVSGALIDLNAGSQGTIANSDLTGIGLANDGGASIFSNTLGSVATNPSLVSELEDNAFAPGSLISLRGTASVDETLNVIPSVSRYVLTGDVTIAAGVTLTVSPGVQVETSSSAYDITVNGTLDASDATFTGPTEMIVNASGELNLTNGTVVSGNSIDLNSGSQGTIANSDLTGIDLFNDGGADVFSNTLGNVWTNPSLVGELEDNAFAADSLIAIRGTASVDETLNVIPNVSRYVLSNDVTIAAGVTLTVSPGVQVETSSSAYDITVNGTLDASDATFTGPTEMIVNASGELNLTNGTVVSGNLIDLNAGSQGTIANSDLTGIGLANDGGASIFSNTLGSVATNPSLVSELEDNAFAPGSLISLRGTASVDETLNVIPDVSRYVLTGDVTIAAGVTLTVSPGVQVETSSSAYDIAVNGTLDASNATFTGPTEMNVNNGGELNLSNGAEVNGFQIDFNNGSSGSFSQSTINTSELLINSGASISIQNNNIMSTDVIADGNPGIVIDMEGNYWGTTLSSNIAARITDNVDDGNRPTIDFEPFLNSEVTLPSGAGPTAVITVADVTSEGGATHSLQVLYSDSTLVDVSTIDSTDVIVVAPGGSQIPVILTNLSTNSDANTVTATYDIPAPGFQWDPIDNGFYTVRVRSGSVFDVDANGNLQVEDTFQVQLTALTAPILTITDVSPTSVSLSWTDSNIESGYHIFDLNDQTPRVNVSADTTSVTIDGLTPNRTYEFYVRAFTPVFVQAVNSNFEEVTTSFADFDADLLVTGRDFLALQRGLGASNASVSNGDANNDQLVNGEDLEIWEDQYGTGIASTSTLVGQIEEFQGYAYSSLPPSSTSDSLIEKRDNAPTVASHEYMPSGQLARATFSASEILPYSAGRAAPSRDFFQLSNAELSPSDDLESQGLLASSITNLSLPKYATNEHAPGSLVRPRVLSSEYATDIATSLWSEDKFRTRSLELKYQQWHSRGLDSLTDEINPENRFEFDEKAIEHAFGQLF